MERGFNIEPSALIYKVSAVSGEQLGAVCRKHRVRTLRNKRRSARTWSDHLTVYVHTLLALRFGDYFAYKVIYSYVYYKTEVTIVNTAVLQLSRHQLLVCIKKIVYPAVFAVNRRISARYRENLVV